jgi:hypothetical protein
MTTVSAKTVIHGYEVELEVDDGTSQCFITKGRHSASLEALMATGVMTNADDEVEVTQGTIEKIEKWAIGKGY